MVYVVRRVELSHLLHGSVVVHLAANQRHRLLCIVTALDTARWLVGGAMVGKQEGR